MMREVVVSLLVTAFLLTIPASAVTIAPPFTTTYAVVSGISGGNIFNVIVDNNHVVGLWGNGSLGPYGGYVAWIEASFNDGEFLANYTEFSIAYEGYDMIPADIATNSISYYVPGHLIWVFTDPAETLGLLVDIDPSTMTVQAACEVPPPDPIMGLIDVLYDADQGKYLVIYSPTLNNNGSKIVMYDPAARACTAISASATYDTKLYLEVNVRLGLVDDAGNVYLFLKMLDVNYHYLMLLYKNGVSYVFNGTDAVESIVYKQGDNFYIFDTLEMYIVNTSSHTAYDYGVGGKFQWTLIPMDGAVRAYHITPTSTGLYYFTANLTIPPGTSPYTEYKVYVGQKGSAPATIKGTSSILIKYSPTAVANATIPFSGYILTSYLTISDTGSNDPMPLGSIPAEAASGVSLSVTTSAIADSSQDVKITIAGSGAPTKIFYPSDVAAVQYIATTVNGTIAMELLPLIYTYSPTTTIKSFKSINNVLILPTGLGDIVDPSDLGPSTLALTKYVVPATSTGFDNITTLNLSVATIANKMVVATEPGVHITNLIATNTSVRIDLDQKGYVVIAAPKGSIESIVAYNGTTNTTICSSTSSCDALFDSDGVITVDPGTLYVTFAQGQTGTDQAGLGGEVTEIPPITTFIAGILVGTMATLTALRVLAGHRKK